MNTSKIINLKGNIMKFLTEIFQAVVVVAVTMSSVIYYFVTMTP